MLPALAIAAILLWPFLDLELLQNAAAGIVLVIAVVATIRLAKCTKWKAIVLPMVCVAALAFASIARIQVTKASDAYVDAFIRHHPCRPAFADLSAANEGWEHGHGLTSLKFRKLGAVRKISYQENGLLRYGFLYDDSRSVWLQECPERGRILQGGSAAFRL